MQISTKENGNLVCINRVLSYPGFELMGLLYYAKIVILFPSFAEMALNSKFWFSVPWFLE